MHVERTLTWRGSTLISRCWISCKNRNRDRMFPKSSLEKYGLGRIEIWKELDDREYYVSIAPHQL